MKQRHNLSTCDTPQSTMGQVEDVQYSAQEMDVSSSFGQGDWFDHSQASQQPQQGTEDTMEDGAERAVAYDGVQER